MCFEHPGLLAPSRRRAATTVCITCSDEGRLGRGGARRATAHAVGADRAGHRARSTRCWSARSSRGPRARPRRHRHRTRRLDGRPEPDVAEGTDFLYPFIEGDERDAGALLVDLAASAEAKVAAERRAARRHARAGSATEVAAAAARWPTRFAPGRPAVHVRQRRQRHRRRVAGGALRAGRPSGRPLPARSSPTTRPCSPRWQRRRLRAGLLAPAHRPRRARRHRPRHLDQRQLAQPARRASRRRGARGLLTRRARRATTAARWRESRDARRTASSCESDSVHRIQETQAALASRLWSAVQALPRRGRDRWLTPPRRSRRPRGGGPRPHRGVPASPAPPHRRGRHPRARRRRQGVGGAGRRRVPRRVRGRRPRPAARCGDARARRRASGSRSAPTRSSCKPLRFPGGSIGHLAVHGTVNDLAVQGARPRVAVGRVRASRRGSRSTSCARSSPTWPRPRGAAGVAIVTGDTKVVGRGAADGLYITTAGVGRDPRRAARSAPSACSPATSCSSRARSPTTAWR